MLGGVPDRIGATNINNFETCVFRRGPFAARYAVVPGNPARFATAEAQVLAYYGGERVAREVALAPNAHIEVDVPSEREGQRLEVVGRRADSGDCVK